MPVVYTQAQIAMLADERKPLPKDWRTKLRFHPKRGHQEGSQDCTGEDGNQFRLILRRNTINHLDFSVILAVQVPQSNQWFRLRRYNGRGHQHTNHIEGNTFDDFHIHMATERYQEVGAREDAYAEATDRYDDFEGALDCLEKDTGFDVPPSDQLSLG